MTGQYDMLETVFAMVVFGLAAAGLTGIVRSLPWPKSWKKRKPLNCMYCLTSWCALGILIAQALTSRVLMTGLDEWFLVWMGSSGVGVWILSHTTLFVDVEEEMEKLSRL